MNVLGQYGQLLSVEAQPLKKVTLVLRLISYRYIEDDTVVFVRCLHRREIYRYFP
jgi:mRNA-degrading endonuclease RelE of RelBE toxin-antitoxin system